VRAVDVIIKKRNGGTLEPDEIRFFVQSVTAGSMPEYQTSALLMAILLQGMTTDETASLTEAMVDSGVRLDLSDIPGTKVDKHSTGGVGDKTSLIIAPVVAACGVAVPMMSGRGLGHTGGTLDKLEAIPGFRVRLSLAEMKAALRQTNCAMIGQTDQIAPADRKLYALRDVTGTVESIPLISASIMSKKIAEGIDALVLDVKSGSGAFMKSEADSRALAESLVAIGNASGVRTEAIITSMDAPLGNAVGNAIEVIECLEVLKGRGPEDLVEVATALAARMLVLGGAARDDAEGARHVRTVLDSGKALDRFCRIIEGQGGDPRIADDYSRLPAVPGRAVVSAERSGYVAAVDAELVGRASVALGAGRDKVDDEVDPAVGILVKAPRGARVEAGDPVLELHYRTVARCDAARPLAARAIVIDDSPRARRPQIIAHIS
jgi:pyrimidine-nucleoside phosphorylase